MNQLPQPEFVGILSHTVIRSPAAKSLANVSPLFLCITKGEEENSLNMGMFAPNQHFDVR